MEQVLRHDSDQDRLSRYLREGLLLQELPKVDGKHLGEGPLSNGAKTMEALGDLTDHRLQDK